ncbi:MAG TPA: type II secretion system protein [Gaiellaceae bacterium]|nr:type II secretion system protein [Gaiellaceae bacterium]
MTKLATNEDGFTLIELLVTIVMLGIVLGGLTAFLATTVKWENEAQEESTMQAEVRAAMDRMTQEIRSAYIGDGTAAIKTLTASQITFDTPDRQTPFHLVQVSYRVANGELDRAYATSTNTGGPPWTIPTLGPWIMVMKSVSSPSPFTYYDSTGAATTVGANVQTVGINLSFSPSTAQGRQFKYQTTVDLRNDQ